MNAFFLFLYRNYVLKNILGILHIKEVAFVDYKSHLFMLGIDCIHFSSFI